MMEGQKQISKEPPGIEIKILNLKLVAKKWLYKPWKS